MKLLVRVAALLLAWAAGTAAAADFVPPERLQVVSDGNYPPYLFHDDDGALHGIIKDRWELWSKYTGIPVRVLAVDWNLAQEMVRNGEADVIDAFVQTRERARVYNFAPGRGRIEARLFYHRSVDAITGVDSLRGLPVGAKEGSACAAWLKGRGVDSIRPYAGSETLVKAAAVGEPRIFCMDSHAARYFLFKHGLREQFHESAALYSTRLDWATGPGHEALRDFVQAGFERIPAEELDDIEKRWVGNPVRLPIAERYVVIATVAALGIVLAAVLLTLWNRTLSRRALYFARVDSLTGLPNRHALRKHLAELMASSATGARVAALSVNLDGFQALNDTYGREFGDRILRKAGQRISQSAGEGCFVGRLGGDEFVVIAGGLRGISDATALARQLVAALNDGIELDDQRVYCSACVGIALHPGDGASATEVIQCADIAMARAKERGRGAVQPYLPEMRDAAKRRLKLETGLRDALAKDQFVLLYQPRVDITSGEVSGFEALLRWRHPDYGLIGPGEFIPVLEETGLIVPVGEWALRTACAQIRRWKASGLRPRPIAVNLSARQFRQKALDLSVARILQESGVDPALLELELTESSLMHDPDDAVRVLHQLEKYGVKLAVDDFGTGYSSLAYLKRFPIHALKIDSSFVRDATRNPDDAAITLAIIQMSHALGLRVVAEGVETPAQQAFLASNGCDEVQGFLFSGPMSAEDTDAWLAGPVKKVRVVA